MKDIDDIVLLARFYSSAGDVLSLHRSVADSTKNIFNIMNNILTNPDLKDDCERVRLQNSITQTLLLKSLAETAKNYISQSVIKIQSFKEAENKTPTFYFAAWFSIDCGRFEEALEYLNESISAFENCPDTAIKFYTYNFKAFSLLRLKRYAEALEFSDVSVKKCKSYFGNSPSDTMAEALTYKAEAKLHTEGSKSALPIIEEALNAYSSFYKGENQVLDQAYANMVKGDCFLLDKKFSDALNSYVRALNIVDNIEATKESFFFRRLILRLIYASKKINQQNISCRYIEISNSPYAASCHIECKSSN